jgi:hypothetical protein
MDRQTDRRIDRNTDRQTKRQKGPDRQIDRWQDRQRGFLLVGLKMADKKGERKKYLQQKFKNSVSPAIP